LIRERNNISSFPNYFYHTGRLLDMEITRVRTQLFHCKMTDDVVKLPEPDLIEEKVVLTEKVYVPVKELPDFNFVGRILGPRGMTAKQLEHETGCKIMVRGRGSMRDETKEEFYRGKTNWEHLDDELHVLLQCEDTKEKAKTKMNIAITQIKKLLVPVPGGIDDLKRKQLMELSMINGNYRRTPTKSKSQQRLVSSLSFPPSQPLVTPPFFHSAIGHQTFFGSPLPSPVARSPNMSYQYNNKIQLKSPPNSKWVFPK